MDGPVTLERLVADRDQPQRLQTMDECDRAFKNGMDVLLEACFKEIADVRQGPFAIREVPNRTSQRIEGSFDHERSAHPSSKTSFNALLLLAVP